MDVWWAWALMSSGEKRRGRGRTGRPRRAGTVASALVCNRIPYGLVPAAVADAAEMTER